MSESSVFSMIKRRVDVFELQPNIQGHELFILRDDLIHPIVSGNKWRKLKHAFAYVVNHKLDGILTYGGAYSNHLVATAEACRMFGVECMLVVRGEELGIHSNVYLRFCNDAGATLVFENRTDFGLHKHDQGIRSINGKSYLVLPEGGASNFGIMGAMEMADPLENYDVIALAQGTTTTSLGVLFNSHMDAEVWCFPVLKGFNSLKEMEKLSMNTGYGALWEKNKHRIRVFSDYSFDGYAKKNTELVSFIDEIHRKYNLKLDAVYTGKSFYGLLKELTLVEGKKTMFIHTGGVLPL